MLKAWVKGFGVTIKLPLILVDFSIVEVGRIRGLAVKCIDITKNSDCEVSLLNYN